MNKFILIIAAIVLLSGCDRVDPAAVAKQIESFEKSVPVLQAAFDQLNAFAVATGSESAIAAAANAKAALDFTVKQIPEMKAELARMKKASDGKVPWWSAILPFLLRYGPKVLIAIPLVNKIPIAGLLLQWLAEKLANADWRISATKKQKIEDQA